MRSGGRTYNVKVSDSKRGPVVFTATVTATSVKEARALAISDAKRAHVVIDDSNLFAHGPTRA